MSMQASSNKVKEALNLTAMIDMMTILLVFLLVQYASMTFSEIDAKSENLPHVEAAGDIKSDTRLILTKDGLKDEKGNAVDMNGVKGSSVSLQVDKTLKMSEVNKIKKELNQVGVSHIELAVIETH